MDTVKDLLNLNSKNDYDLAQWLVNQNIGWSLDNSGQLDFNKGQTGGIPISSLESFFVDFPARVLSDEELKLVNRIGDNVKMIMQTLKYWTQILRDERVAIARNI
nr:molecular chaperone [Vibrio parahaemolyticus]